MWTGDSSRCHLIDMHWTAVIVESEFPYRESSNCKICAILAFRHRVSDIRLDWEVEEIDGKHRFWPKVKIMIVALSIGTVLRG